MSHAVGRSSQLPPGVTQVWQEAREQAGWGLVDKSTQGTAGSALLPLEPDWGRSRGSEGCLETRPAQGLAGAAPSVMVQGQSAQRTQGTASEQGVQRPAHRPAGAMW